METAYPPRHRAEEPPPPGRPRFFLLGVAVGLVTGLVIGVIIGAAAVEGELGFMKDLVLSEPPADVEHPRVLTGERYRLSYPGNWQDDPDDDPDLAVTIESHEGSTFLLTVASGPEDPAENIAAMKEAWVTEGEEPESFTRWGSFEGTGESVRETTFGFEVEYRFFSHSSERTSFTVMEMIYEEDRHLVEPGFELIRRTFALIDDEAGADDETEAGDVNEDEAGD